MRHLKLSMKIESIVTIYISSILLTLPIMRIFTLGEVSFNLALSDWLLPLFFILILVDMIRTKSMAHIHYIWLFVLLVMWLVLTNILAVLNTSILTNTWPSVIGEWIKTATCIGYFYVGYNCLRHMSKIIALRIILSGYALFIGYGLLMIVNLQLGYDLPMLDQDYGAFFLGTYTDPNHAATLIGICFMLLNYMLHIDKAKIWNVFYGGMMLLSVTALLLTDSRGGVFAFVIGTFAYMVLRYWNDFRAIVSFFYMLIIFGCIGIIWDSAFNVTPYFGKLYSSMIQLGQAVDVREGLRSVAFEMWKDHWLTGVGRGNYIVNAPVYFDTLGYRYVEDIPHHTIFGLLSEVGCVGFALYMIGILLLVSAIAYYVRNNQPSIRQHRSILSSAVGIGLIIISQSLLLNIENQRVLWLLLGLILYALRNSELSELVMKEKKSDKKQNLHFWINSCLAFFVIIFLFIASITGFRVIDSQNYSSNLKKVLPIGNNWIDKEVTVEFYLNSSQLDMKQQETMIISIVEVVNGVELILAEEIYPITNGTLLMRVMKKHADSEIYMYVQKVSEELIQYRFQLKRLWTESDMLMLNRDYYLLTENLEKKRNETLWSHYDEVSYVEKYYAPFLNDFEGAVYDDKFSIEAVNVKSDSHETLIEISYLCLGEMVYDYTLFLYGDTMYLNDFQGDQYTFRENYSPSDEYHTSDWEVGQRYTIVYRMARTKGWYKLLTYAYFKGEEVEWLIDDKERKYIWIGWMTPGVKK